jgi:hypothetical protein
LGRLPDFGPLQSGYDHFYGFRGGVLDYYTHKYGPPASDTEDLWDDDTRVQQPGYLTDLLGSRAVEVVNAYANPASRSSSACTSTPRIGRGKRRATRRSRSASKACFTSTAAPSAPINA